MRVAIVSECFLPVVNGVTNSVRQIVEHLGASGHDVLIVAPGDGQADHAGVPVVRLPALELPVVTSIPVGVPRGCTPGARGVDAARFTPRKRCAALRDAVRRLLDSAVRARFGATARRSVLRRTWSTVGDELIAHYAAVLDGFPVNSDVRAATPGPVSARPHVA